MRNKILLLGSGELGKEVVIALQRLGQYVIAVDSYPDAPAMQVAHDYEVINMLDGDALDQIVKKHNPNIIVPEVESIRTERFYDYEKQGFKVVPSAKAANFTMNRKAIRDLAAIDLNIKTAKYKYASSYDELKDASIFDAAKMWVKGQLKHSLKWNHWRPISYWTHVQGECGLDFVGRVENLGEDLPRVCEKIGLPVSAVPHINTSKHGHYTEYLDDEPKARDMLAQYYWQDLESFGYEY